MTIRWQAPSGMLHLPSQENSLALCSLPDEL